MPQAHPAARKDPHEPQLGLDQEPNGQRTAVGEQGPVGGAVHVECQPRRCRRLINIINNQHNQPHAERERIDRLRHLHRHHEHLHHGLLRRSSRSTTINSQLGKFGVVVVGVATKTRLNLMSINGPIDFEINDDGDYYVVPNRYRSHR